MAERLIPIQIEGRGTPARESLPDTDSEEIFLSQSLEELSVDSRDAKVSGTKSKSSQEESTSSQLPYRKPKVQVKPAPSSNTQLECLKEFDVLKSHQEKLLPNMNTPEHIILVIDQAQDENFTPFVTDTQKFTPLSMLKRALDIFIKLKHNINPLHKFAIVVMNENSAKFLMPFTSDIAKLKNCIHKLSECETEDIFDMNTIFDIIMQNESPQPLASGLPPPFVLRTIIFYGRSYTIPKVIMTEELSNLLDNPFFTCDILMTHEPLEISNHCQKIFNILQNLDKKGNAYFFPVCRDMRRLHRCTGRLLAHPLQRPIQKLTKS